MSFQLQQALCNCRASRLGKVKISYDGAEFLPLFQIIIRSVAGLSVVTMFKLQHLWLQRNSKNSGKY